MPTDHAVEALVDFLLSRYLLRRSVAAYLRNLSHIAPGAQGRSKNEGHWNRTQIYRTKFKVRSNPVLRGHTIKYTISLVSILAV